MKAFFKVISDWDFQLWLRAILLILAHYGFYFLFSRGPRLNEFLIYYGLAFFCLFGISASYHRYFSHRAFKLNRFWQFMFALQGLSTFQWGPLWWASHHRVHHTYADQDGDPHNPQKSVFQAYLGWFMRKESVAPRYEIVPDFAKYPELIFLEKHSLWFSLGWVVCFYFIGQGLAFYQPRLLIDGFILVQLYACAVMHCFHACSFINTYSHLKGDHRYDSKDCSRNNGFWFLAIPSGETWHNNHHYCAQSAKMSYRWWQVDPTYLILKGLSYVGIVQNIKLAPREMMEASRA